MLSVETIKNIATKFQTTELNVIREYLQHLFLSYLYRINFSDKFFFKGGTALRLVYNSPRFSEDLDFSTSLNSYKVKTLISTTIKKVSEQIEVNTIEDLKPISGGYFGKLKTEIYNWPIFIELNISSRKTNLSGETTLITTQLYPSYTVNILSEKHLVVEKTEALITRGKPRDYFDLYYIIKNRIAIKEITNYKTELHEKVKAIDNKKLKHELKEFLPRSYWNLLGNFRGIVLKELNRM